VTASPTRFRPRPWLRRWRRLRGRWGALPDRVRRPGLRDRRSRRHLLGPGPWLLHPSFLISMTFPNNADPSNRKDFYGW